ncbi:unnamed protein product [Didymodactylos carnosus]|uniref:Uncharacterized protein n=1 Tax=Didymodactylos carnosus TaxID=1234261 RepID=A0A813Z385_9BILA|nr:unnamed protein product [Didymodactylos carnosus]CAF3676370.1 unnamed protein product [Didymodactylos carnosus]
MFAGIDCCEESSCSVDDDEQRIIYEILVKRQPAKRPYADISDLSYSEDEKEILISACAVFHNYKMTYNKDEGYWYMKVLLSNHRDALDLCYNSTGDRLKEINFVDAELIRIGYLYHKTTNVKEIIDYYSLIRDYLPNLIGEPVYHTGLGLIKHTLQQYDSAVERLLKALGIYEQRLSFPKNLKYMLIIIYDCLAACYLQKTRFFDSLNYYHKAMKIDYQYFLLEKEAILIHPYTIACMHKIRNDFDLSWNLCKYLIQLDHASPHVQTNYDCDINCILPTNYTRIENSINFIDYILGIDAKHYYNTIINQYYTLGKLCVENCYFDLAQKSFQKGINLIHSYKGKPNYINRCKGLTERLLLLEKDSCLLSCLNSIDLRQSENCTEYLYCVDDVKWLCQYHYVEQFSSYKTYGKDWASVHHWLKQENDTRVVSDTDISSKNVKRFCNCLLKEMNITKLVLCKCTINDSDFNELIDTINNGSSIRTLHLCEMCLSNKLHVLFTSRLRNIILEDCKIYDQGTNKIGKALKENKDLLSLQLHRQDLSKYAYIGIAKALETNTTLTHLGLYPTKLETEGVKQLLQSLQYNSSLKYLSLKSYYPQSSNGCELPLFNMLSKNKTLENFSISSSFRIFDLGTQKLFEGLENNTALLELNFTNTGRLRNCAPSSYNMLLTNKTLKNLKMSCLPSNIFLQKLFEGLENNTALLELKLEIMHSKINGNFTLLNDCAPLLFNMLLSNKTLKNLEMFRCFLTKIVRSFKKQYNIS